MAPEHNRNSSDELIYLRAEVKRLRKVLRRQTPGLGILLKQRGFRIHKQEPFDDIFIPDKKYQTRYYRMLHKYSFRLFLRDVIKQQEVFGLDDVTRYATPAITKKYIDYLMSIKLIKKKAKDYTLVRGSMPIRSFGPTLEWYVAEIFRREFASETVWGVKFKRPNVGGDYDVIAKLNGSLIYSEVKSSPPKQIYDSEIASFLDRVEDLAPSIAVFLMDTELRMKDKLVPMFEKELKKRYETPPVVNRMERELFEINGRVFIINAKESIIHNFEKIISWHYRTLSGLT